jgi:TFIIF-interacting CTD phosphatase-like protein
MRQFVWASQRCTLARNWSIGDYQTLKQLIKLKRRGYALEGIIAVDDTPSKHARNFGNLVTVEEFVGAESDRELLLLMPYLAQLAKVANVRTVEKRRWRAQVALLQPGEAGLPAG